MCYLSALLTDVTLLDIAFVFSLDCGKTPDRYKQVWQADRPLKKDLKKKKKKHLEKVVISSSGRWNRLVILSGPLAKLGLVKEIDGEI